MTEPAVPHIETIATSWGSAGGDEGQLPRPVGSAVEPAAHERANSLDGAQGPATLVAGGAPHVIM